MAVVHVKRSERIARRVGAFAATPRHQRSAISAALVVTFWHAGFHLAAAVLAVGLFGHRSQLRTAYRIRKRYNTGKHKMRKIPTKASWPAVLIRFTFAFIEWAIYAGIALIRAILPELGDTKRHRARKRLDRMWEVRQVTPAPETVGFDDSLEEGEKYTLRLNIAGLTVEGLRRYIPGILLYFGNRAIDVRIAEHPNHKGMCFLYLVTKDLLKDSLGTWPLLNEPIGSRSISDGILAGTNVANKRVHLDLTGDAVFVAGQRNQGKSGFLHQMAGGAVLCRDVDPWIFDMRDGSEFFMYADRVPVFVDTPEKALAALTRLRELRKERSYYLREKGLLKWKPGCGLKFILLIIDEVAEFDDGTPGPSQVLLTKIVRLGRAAGIGAVMGTQRPDAKYIDTALRAQCNVGISYRVRPGDEQISLGPGAKSLGLEPHKLPPHQFIMLGSDALDGVKCRGWYLGDGDAGKLAARLPRLEPNSSIDLSTLDTIGHENPQHIEPLPESEAQASNGQTPTPEPPPECDGNDRALRLWEALPGEPRALIEASGFTRQRVHQILTKWDADDIVEKVGNEWRHRDPAEIDRIMA
jgi:hypothetical protein